MEALTSISKDKGEFLVLVKRKCSSPKELKEVSQVDFEQRIRTLANTPPLKLKDLKEELRKGKEEKIKSVKKQIPLV